VLVVLTVCTGPAVLITGDCSCPQVTTLREGTSRVGEGRGALLQQESCDEEGCDKQEQV